VHRGQQRDDQKEAEKYQPEGTVRRPFDEFAVI
jgi:hypothetical protein